MKNNRLTLLDIFCGAGGASMGYYNAGFEVVGVDKAPQPSYPFKFYRADAFAYLKKNAGKFDVFHASPPCQKYCRMYMGLIQAQGREKQHPDYISSIRQSLISTGKPYVIENVEGAPLDHPIKLCGSSFGLNVQRHRLFECSFGILAPPCQHHRYKPQFPPLHRLQAPRSRVVGCYGNGRGKGDTVKLWQDAMGIDWMTRKELAQAIPPAYTYYIGQVLIDIINGVRSD